MPEVRNCRKCGKIFNYIGGMPICFDCKAKEEKDFKRVKEYLYDNPGATLSEVSTVLDVSVERIKSYLREGRLEIINNEGNFILECESCGKSIKTGRFCQECSMELSKGFKSTADRMNKKLQQDAERKGMGLRYLNKEDL